MLRTYLKGCGSTVRTDHDPLKWILNLTDSTEMLTLWRPPISEFEFNVVHHAGKKQQATDALLWLRTTETDQTPIEDNKTVLCITTSISPKKERGKLCISRLRPIKRKRRYFVTCNIRHRNIDGNRGRNTPCSCTPLHTWTGEGSVLSPSAIYSRIIGIKV